MTVREIAAEIGIGHPLSVKFSGAGKFDPAGFLTYVEALFSFLSLFLSSPPP
jgi:hypothetical protein